MDVFVQRRITLFSELWTVDVHRLRPVGEFPVHGVLCVCVRHGPRRRSLEAVVAVVSTLAVVTW